MAKYKRNSQARSRNTRRKGSSLTWVFILFGILIGILSAVGGFMFFANSPTSKPTHILVQKPSEKVAKKEKDSAQRFEFYTLLPGMEVQLPDAPSKTVAQTAKKQEPVKVIVQSQSSPPAAPASEKTSSKAIAQHPQEQSSGKALAATKNATAQYIVQAGIFQDLPLADELKAKLTLQGFNTHIQKVQTQEGQTWFRVTLGPFTTESSALNHKKRLEEQKIHGILILQRPSS